MKAIRDFDPEDDLGYNDMMKLEHLVRSGEYVEFIRTEKERRNTKDCIDEETADIRIRIESGEDLTKKSKEQNTQQNEKQSDHMKATEQADPDGAAAKQEGYTCSLVNLGYNCKRQPSTSIDLDEIYGSEVGAQLLEFKREDQLETILPVNIG